MKPNDTARQRFRRWLTAIDPLAQHPRLGAVLGLLLVAALIPIIRFWHGPSGPLGQSIPLFFLVPVLLASVIGGREAGVVVSCAAIFTWDWFFIPPYYTVTIASVRDVLALVVFLAMALLVGQLSTVARRRTQEALRRARSSEALYELSMSLIARRDLADLLPTLTQRLLETFDLAAAAVLLPGESPGTWRTFTQAGRMPADLQVEENRSLASTISRVYTRGEECRLGHVRRGPGRSERVVLPRAGAERARLLPLRIGSRVVGVLELVPRANEKPDLEREHLLTTFANGAAIALEQARLAEEERAAAVARESDRLKSALLSSVSHDLRTPLAGIKAAASSLLQEDVQWSEEDRHTFLVDIDHEADRLTRLVSNLLDLSRIEAGAIKPNKDWEDVGELIDRVVAHLAPRLAGFHVVRTVPEALPAVRLDAIQIEQVLTNLLENAAKYAPSGTTITVSARTTLGPDGNEALQMAVADQGPGIPLAEQERIFDKFYRVASSGSHASGTGMGLAIVKGLVEAHGGHVAVDSAPGLGSTFTITLPLEGAGSAAAPSPPAPQDMERMAR